MAPPEEVRILSRFGNIRGIYQRQRGELPVGIEIAYKARRAQAGMDVCYLYLCQKRWVIGPELGGNVEFCEAEAANGDDMDNPTVLLPQPEKSAWQKYVTGIESGFGGSTIEAQAGLQRLAIHSKFPNLHSGLRRQAGKELVWSADSKQLFLWHQASQDEWMLTEGAPGTPAARQLLVKAPANGSLDPRLGSWSDPIDGVSEVWWAEIDISADNRCLWKDPDFPPGSASLGTLKIKEEVEWIAARDLERDREHAVLFDSIEPSDLMQGALGDCWLIAALAAVAEYPYLLEGLFNENVKKLPEDGKHAVSLFDVRKKKWEKIVVDEFVPCKKRHWFELHATPLFSKPVGHEMWVLLMEKAFAKMLGGYDKLKGGRPVFAWQVLTGVLDQRTISRVSPSVWEEYQIDVDEEVKELQAGRMSDLPLERDDAVHQTFSDETLWRHMQTHSPEHVMAAVVEAGEHTKPTSASGLIADHAYSILLVDEVAGRRFIHLRNPHGEGAQWKGDWGPKNQIWSTADPTAAALKAKAAELAPSGHADHGSFWMSYADFVKEFNCVSMAAVKLTKDASGQSAVFKPAAAVTAGVPAGWGGLEISGPPTRANEQDSCVDRCANSCTLL